MVGRVARHNQLVRVVHGHVAIGVRVAHEALVEVHDLEDLDLGRVGVVELQLLESAEIGVRGVRGVAATAGWSHKVGQVLQRVELDEAGVGGKELPIGARVRQGRVAQHDLVVAERAVDLEPPAQLFVACALVARAVEEAIAANDRAVLAAVAAAAAAAIPLLDVQVERRTRAVVARRVGDKRLHAQVAVGRGCAQERQVVLGAELGEQVEVGPLQREELVVIAVVPVVERQRVRVGERVRALLVVHKQANFERQEVGRAVPLEHEEAQ